MTLIIILIAVALIFDFLNGLHDAANSIATIVSTRVLSPRYAVAWAAFFNFIAFAVFGLHVANTIGTGIVSPAIISDQVIFGALMGAIVWNVITWLAGIPSSSSHALIGGLVGAGVCKAGWNAVVWQGLGKTIAAIVASPLTGFLLALLLVLFVSWTFLKATPFKVDKWFRHVQFVSASAYSLGHGGNDAQKTMGIIAALLFAHGFEGGNFHVPLWVVLACQTAMALGTLFGGWRIVRTMGSRITHLTPLQGVCAETAGSITLFMATHMGIPVSTTHTITGAIVGVGAARRVSAVRWNVAKDIVVAWIVTMPAAGLIAAVFYFLAGAFGLS
jgi:PiT family inorganic phosphate transporter